MSIAGGVDRERIEMLELALTRLDDADSPDRARLLALLSRRAHLGRRVRRSLLAWRPEPSTWRGAPATTRRWWTRSASASEAIAMPQTLPLRLRWNREACALADTLGDPTARLHANDYLYLAGLEAGDPETMRIPRAILHAEAERIGQPIYRWVIEYHDALDWMLAGDLVAAERAMTDALTLGAEAGYPEDAITIYGAPAHDPALDAGSFPRDGPAHRAGRVRQPRPRDLPRRSRRGPGLRRPARRGAPDPRHRAGQRLPDVRRRHLARGPDALGRGGRRAAATDPRRRPSTNACCRGTTSSRPSHITAQGAWRTISDALAHTLDLHDEADEWFSQALAFHEAMEAPFFVALTQAAWAGLLADRGQAGDVQRARALAGSRATRR